MSPEQIATLATLRNAREAAYATEDAHACELCARREPCDDALALTDNSVAAAYAYGAYKRQLRLAVAAGGSDAD